jgi:hypothetical protein
MAMIQRPRPIRIMDRKEILVSLFSVRVPKLVNTHGSVLERWFTDEGFYRKSEFTSEKPGLPQQTQSQRPHTNRNPRVDLH